VLKVRLVVPLFCLGFIAPLNGAQVKQRFPAHLVSVKAMLYYTDTGKFSEDLISAPDLALWNTIIGEGSAKGPANSLLIVVEVAGDGGPNVYTSDKLVVAMQVQGKPPSRKQISHLVFSPSGQHFEALWLDGIGCAGPVTITAQVNQQPLVQKKLDFQCGE
jgi:hypothetical protein